MLRYFIVTSMKILPFPHIVPLSPCVLLKQRTGSRSSLAWACGAPPSPRPPVCSGSWRAVWMGCGGPPRSPSGGSRGTPGRGRDTRWWISSWRCVLLYSYPCDPGWRGPATAASTAASTSLHRCRPCTEVLAKRAI